MPSILLWIKEFKEHTKSIISSLVGRLAADYPLQMAWILFPLTNFYYKNKKEPLNLAEESEHRIWKQFYASILEECRAISVSSYMSIKDSE